VGGVKETESIYIAKAGKLIHNKDEMEQYFSEIRAKMTRILNENKTIIIK